MFAGRLLAIRIADSDGQPTRHIPHVMALPNQGLEGDRYAHRGDPRPEAAVTLIEQETLVAVARDVGLAIDHAMTRRNLLTEGVPLNHLVGRDFFVGEVRLHGVELCEPCHYLERKTIPGIREALIHRGGLRTKS